MAHSEGESVVPMKPCRYPGCRRLSTTGWCDEHKSEPWGSTHKPTRLRGRRSQDRRKRIAERDGFCCQICGRVTAVGIADHIIPLAFGGEDTEDNMQWVCPACHLEKSIEEKKA